jgi:2-oxoglutarate ferredoxin oxidoreductase subunit beta
VNVKILLFNNKIYGLTKGQYSPTSELGKVTKSTPMGSADRPVSPCVFALAAGATYVARTVDRSIGHMEETLRRAAAHKGAAFVEILQNCNVYNDLAWNVLYDKESKVQFELRLEHGKPITWGPADDRRGLVLDRLKPKVVKVADVAESALWVHDETDRSTATLLAQLWAPEYPIPLGTLLNEPGGATYEEIVVQQEQKAISDRGPGDIAKLLVSGETWKIG